MKTLFVALGALLRVVPHLPNFTPIGALALFGSAHGSKRFALLVPLGAMALSDLWLGGHSTLPFVYASFVLIALLGMYLFRDGVTPARAVGGSLAASMILFVVSNFGVWAAGTLYPRTLEGLVTCYAMALPFLRNTLLGDLFYVGVLFGGYELARRAADRLQPALAEIVIED